MKNCSVCGHERALEIDVALLERVTHAVIADRFEVSAVIVGRHQRQCLPGLRRDRAIEHREAFCLTGVLVDLAKAQRIATRIAETADKAGDTRTALDGARTMVQAAKARGELLLKREANRLGVDSKMPLVQIIQGLPAEVRGAAMTAYEREVSAIVQPKTELTQGQKVLIAEQIIAKHKYEQARAVREHDLGGHPQKLAIGKGLART